MRDLLSWLVALAVKVWRALFDRRAVRLRITLGAPRPKE